MTRVTLVFVLILSLALFACARIDFRTWKDFASSEELSQKRQSAPTPLWFTQKLDNFDPNSASWQQKYYVNTTFYKPGGPLFMFLGGEGPLRSDCASGHFVMNYYAPIFNAVIACAEHRFYGDSVPTKDYSVENLRYLTSQQALADYANITSYIMATYAEGSNTKVISFGGSYPGMLSAWFRLKYPNLVTASVASSAPVNAQKNFQEYLQVVGASLATVPSGTCTQTVHNAVKYYSGLLQNKVGQSEVQRIFKTCSDLSVPLDQVTWQEGFADAISGFVQYNRDNNGYYPFDINEDTCMDSSYTDDLRDLMDVDPKASSASSRCWYWQTCNEFGFFQPALGTTQPFSPSITLRYFTDMCQSVFGVSDTKIDSNIYKTNLFYGARKIKTDKVVFINGAIDPWHALGIVDSQPDKDLPAYLMKTTAHCADLYPPTPSDPAELTATRAHIVAYIKKWLN